MAFTMRFDDNRNNILLNLILIYFQVIHNNTFQQCLFTNNLLYLITYKSSFSKSASWEQIWNNFKLFIDFFCGFTDNPSILHVENNNQQKILAMTKRASQWVCCNNYEWTRLKMIAFHLVVMFVVMATLSFSGGNESKLWFWSGGHMNANSIILLQL